MKKLLTAVMFVLFSGTAFHVMAADDVVAVGKLVKVDYTLTVNKEEIESSKGKAPLQFIPGDKAIIPGLEKALIGMHIGEEKVVTVEPKDAYGEPDLKAIKEFPKTSMPKNIDLKMGMVLQAQAPDGESFPATIKELKGDQVVLDFNHPLAGKQLQFKVKILSVETAPVRTAPISAAPVVPAVKK